jgi:hypothetical protein
MESTIHQQAVPVALATPEIRTAYLRRVTTITMLGLAIAAAVGLLSTFLLAQNPTLLTGYFPMVIIPLLGRDELRGSRWYSARPWAGCARDRDPGHRARVLLLVGILRPSGGSAIRST